MSAFGVIAAHKRRTPLRSWNTNSATRMGWMTSERYQTRSRSITFLFASRLQAAVTWLARCHAKKIAIIAAAENLRAVLSHRGATAGISFVGGTNAAKPRTPSHAIAQKA